MAETQQVTKTYSGNCHCGAFVFELTVPEIKAGFECNCSLCFKKGYCWTFAPENSYNLVKGAEEDLTSYSLTGTFIHKFCPTCGTALMAAEPARQPDKSISINIRVLQLPFDFWSVEKKPVDGASWGSKYEPPKFTGPEPEGGPADGKLYYGCCHCGRVQLALKSKPLHTLLINVEEDRVIECSCSICQRGAYIWLYLKPEQIIVQGEDSLTQYVSGDKVGPRAFCRTCGVQIMDTANPLTEGELANLSDSARDWHARNTDARYINLRVLTNFDATALKTRKGDGWLSRTYYINPDRTSHYKPLR